MSFYVFQENFIELLGRAKYFSNSSENENLQILKVLRNLNIDMNTHILLTFLILYFPTNYKLTLLNKLYNQ